MSIVHLVLLGLTLALVVWSMIAVAILLFAARRARDEVNAAQSRFQNLRCRNNRVFSSGPDDRWPRVLK